MKQYQLAIIQPDGPPPPPERLGPIMQNVRALIEASKKAQVWVFNGGLTSPSSATMVRTVEGEAVLTDGPYLESKEFIGGLLVVRAKHARVAS